MNNFIAFFGSIAVVASLLLGLVYLRTGGVSGFKAYFTTGEGKGAAASALLAIAVIAGIVLAMYSVSSHAEKNKWFQYTDVYFGVDYTKKQSPQCDSGGADDRLTSNIGIRQHVVELADDVDLLASYTHHSCVIGKDRNGYDGVGAAVNWRFNW